MAVKAEAWCSVIHADASLSLSKRFITFQIHALKSSTVNLGSTCIAIERHRDIERERETLGRV